MTALVEGWREGEIDIALHSVVMQPTTLCNLNCSYCYLPHRRANQPMDLAVAEAVATSLATVDRAARGDTVTIFWHCGEPLATPREHFCRLLEPFEPLRRAGWVRHHVQTNATLITDDWIAALRRFEIDVGVSIDGPAPQNRRRLTWNGDDSSDRALRGIDRLRNAGIRFGAIAVVGEASFDDAPAIYDFFHGLGCTQLAINIEEREGVHQSSPTNVPRVQQFWMALLAAWCARPGVYVRDLARAIGWLERLVSGTTDVDHLAFDWYLTVASDGRVVVHSPELLGITDAEHGDFIVGNVRTEPLEAVLARARTAAITRGYLAGVRQCRQTCSYFAACRGGLAGNKYFENKRFDSTETWYCRNSIQATIDAVAIAVTANANASWRRPESIAPMSPSATVALQALAAHAKADLDRQIAPAARRRSVHHYVPGP